MAISPLVSRSLPAEGHFIVRTFTFMSCMSFQCVLCAVKQVQAKSQQAKASSLAAIVLQG